MSNLLANRLLFLSNAKYILEAVRPIVPAGNAPAQLSLDAIKPMPASLALPLTRHIRRLAVMNMPPPQGVSAEVEAIAQARIFGGRPDHRSHSLVLSAIEATRAELAGAHARRRPKRPPGSQTDLELFESAAANYLRHRCFCHYDWRWKHWGTIEDVHSVVPATFELPTTAVEFTTKWTPPVAAMEALAQMFPSVRFELSYRYRRRDAWTTVEIFPTTPFGY